MSNLGSFGAAVRELDPDGDRDTFDFFDKTFTVHGVLPPVLQVQLGAASSGNIEEAQGLAAIWETMRCCLTKPPRTVAEFDPKTRKPKVEPEDASQFHRWFKLAVDNRCQLDELLKLAMALFEAQSGLPTEGQSISSGGEPTTSPTSNGSSTPPGRLVPVAELLG
jgi:hypothetical protein